MHITTLPVYSKLAAAEDVATEQLLCQTLQGIEQRTGQPFILSQHQLDTYKALKKSDVDVVINTAMTGDGKSLAGLLPLLVDRREILALYPTNELIQDQYASASRTLTTWQRPDRWVHDLYGERLDARVAELEHARRGDVILGDFFQHKLVLSNPDIFHYILQFCYQQPGRAADWIAGRLPNTFGQLTFDEFHIFDLPQVASVLTGLLFLYAQRPVKTLFLSATPDAFLPPLLRKAGLRFDVVSLEGCYHHGADPGAGWRPILQECDLHVDPLNAEAWVEAHLDDILLPFFQQHRPSAKGAVIVNSLASAQRLFRRIEPAFRAAGLSVLLNTGLTSRAERRASYAAHLLIGTSTVDVGVDFQINFLVFEASDAGTFLQRLGRLGRHTSYTSETRTYTFDVFCAYALVPDFMYERLCTAQAGQAPPLTLGASLTRAQLGSIIETAFPPPAKFPAYLQHWGRFQPAHVIATLSSAPIRDSYATMREQLRERYETTFDIRLSKAWGMGKRMKDEGRALLVQEARSFRGRSLFDCAVLVPTHSGFTRDPQTYDMFWLLANAELDWLDQAEFFAAIPAQHPAIAAIQRSNPVAYLRLLDYREERTDVLVRLPPDIAAWGSEMHHTAQVMCGLKVERAGVPWLNTLNRHLVQRNVVGLLMPYRHPLEVRRRLRVPLHFALHMYEDTHNGHGCIAFGRQALILDTVLRYRTLGGDTPEAAIVL